VKGIKNIIFDLGGVIIDLDMQATISAFNKLSSVRFEEFYTQATQIELFNAFDKGTISELDFFCGTEITHPLQRGRRTFVIGLECHVGRYSRAQIGYASRSQTKLLHLPAQ
jgi:hypothetical protein